ncbi:MAG: agmatinase [Thermoproteota archaeon]|nr:agmatinase [Thermoproteota archaeon]
MSIDIKFPSYFFINKLYKEFCGIQKSFKEAKYVIIGIPYENTITYRPGTKFAPSYIRDVSINIETYCLLSKMYFEDVDFYDIGDIDVVGIKIEEALRRISLVIEDIKRENKIPVCIGGEHSITYGIVRSIKPDTIICFDAHLDLRDEYPISIKYGHATIMRRIYEDLGIKNIIYIGSRAFSKEEFNFATKHDLKIFSMEEIDENKKDVINELSHIVNSSKKIYISVDMDVFDPSIAPGVGTPEPYGISFKDFLDIVKNILDKKVEGLDIVEVSPLYDNGLTSILASKIIFECVSLLYKKIKPKS